MVKSLTGYTNTDNHIERKVAGVSPGENIMMNGIVIGKVTDNNLTIISKNNEIIDMIGGNIKKHGLEKLGKVDLSKAIIKTGLLRKADDIKPRIIKHQQNEELKAVYLDHAAEDIYQYKDADILLSVGDDTTLLSSDILYRFSIPIIGITDGDLDRVVQKAFRLNDSLIIQVQSGYDDILGKEIFNRIFNNKIIITIKDIDTFKNQVIDVIDEFGIDYEFVDK